MLLTFWAIFGLFCVCAATVVRRVLSRMQQMLSWLKGCGQLVVTCATFRRPTEATTARHNNTITHTIHVDDCWQRNAWRARSDDFVESVDNPATTLFLCLGSVI